MNPPPNDHSPGFLNENLSLAITDRGRSDEGIRWFLQYLLVPCTAARKWFVVELSDEIRMAAFALANYEFYSSGVAQLTLLGSTAYPCVPERGCMWQLLGHFNVAATMGLQEFALKTPVILRYLKVVQFTVFPARKSAFT